MTASEHDSSNRIRTGARPRRTPASRALGIVGCRPGTIVQVGANDGWINDPLADPILRHRERVRKAVLIEPQPGAFEKLAERYRDVEQVVCMRVAIGHEVGERAFYSIDREAASILRKPVSDRIGSFRREHVERFLRTRARSLSPKALSTMIVRLDVPVTTLAKAAEEAGVGHPDILLVDAEGLDGEIVTMALDAGWRWPCCNGNIGTCAGRNGVV